jgi:hypothetical protein
VSLDFVILRSSGAPEHEVRVHEDEHRLLIAAAGRVGLQQLSRVDDYYGKVEYSTEQVGLLVAELRRLDRSQLGDAALAVVQQLEELCSTALASGSGIWALGD